MQADLCKVVATERRLAILWVLSRGEKCVGEIAKALGLSIHNVSQHLRVMKEREVVTSTKRAQSHVYSLANPKFLEGCCLIREAMLDQHRQRGSVMAAVEAQIASEGRGAGPGTTSDPPPDSGGTGGDS
ncbi:helix-turn-helix transcriptional regulator [Candidatus Sumerlaeota bacterium]|nr:helix-turn-helix transcriptional regulator [Candidatus Sumerlaeota bacterium]